VTRTRLLSVDLTAHLVLIKHPEDRRDLTHYITSYLAYANALILFKANPFNRGLPTEPEVCSEIRKRNAGNLPLCQEIVNFHAFLVEQLSLPE